MQNRYVADIGDFVKLAILRRLSTGRRLGVAWWLFPDESHNNDGGNREFLKRPGKWRHFDCGLFDGLLRIDKEKTHNVAALEPFLEGATFEGRCVPCDALPYSRRPIERHEWLLDVRQRFKNHDLIFLDPDNGIAPKSLTRTQRRAGESIFLDDLRELKEKGRAIVLYHHQSRLKGGHQEEIRTLANLLGENGYRVCGALRAKPWSPRAFFILDGDDELCNRAQEIERNWDGWIKWYSGSRWDPKFDSRLL